MVTSQLDLPNFFSKGKQTNRSKTFSWNMSSTYYVHMWKSKKIKKDNNNFK